MNNPVGFQGSPWLATFTPTSRAQMTLVSFLDSCDHLLDGPLASVLGLLCSSLHAAVRVILQ